MMTKAENELSNVLRTMKGYFSELNSEKHSTSAERSPSITTTTCVESHNCFQQQLQKNGSQRSKLLSVDILKMQKGETQNAKKNLRRSQSSNAGNDDVNSKRLWIKSRNFNNQSCEGILSNKSAKASNPTTELISSRGSYRDDAVSTNSDSAPLLPFATFSCSEAHENEACSADSNMSHISSSSSILSNRCTKTSINMDNLSLYEIDPDCAPRISKMDDNGMKKPKSSAKSLYNIKTCSESDNKEINTVINVAQSASTCLHPPLKKGHSQNSFKQFFQRMNSHKEEKRTFTDDSKRHQNNSLKPSEKFTYDQLVTKPESYLYTPSYSAESDERQVRTRHHSSLSESENLFQPQCKFTVNINTAQSRSDGADVTYIDEELTLYTRRGNAASRCKSFPLCRTPTCLPLLEGGSSHSAITTSSRSLPTPTTLECNSNSRTFLFERQTSLPHTTSTCCCPSSEHHGSSDRRPPLPSKGGSRSNLSPPFVNVHIDEGCTLCHNKSSRTAPWKSYSVAPVLHSRVSPPGMNCSHHQLQLINSSQNLNQTDTTTVESNHGNPPPLPPKNPHRLSSCSGNRCLNSEDSGNVEISSSSDSSNFTSSIESENVDSFSATCICKQIAALDGTRAHPPPPPKPTIDSRHLAVNSTQAFRVEINSSLRNSPMPGRYETSDSFVYEDFRNDSRVSWNQDNALLST